METKRRRRWFAFSLRTLFVLVTAFAIWLGWNLSIVRERQAMWNSIEARGGSINGLNDYPFDYDGPEVEVPLPRRILGDRAALIIFLETEEFSDEEIAQVKAIFPEAQYSIYLLTDANGPFKP